MKMLAVEFSTAQGSIAVLEDGVLMAQACWTESRSLNRQQMFAHLTNVLNQARVTLSEIEVYVAGRGPGAYTGLRMASAVMSAMAIPVNKPVYGVSSGAALANHYLSQPDVPGPVVVLGDARRNRLWVGVFSEENMMTKILPEWALFEKAAFLTHLPENSLILSPDWSRLQDWATGKAFATNWIPEMIAPNAAMLGTYATHRLNAGLPLEPPTPIYMHPAVA